MNSITVDLPEEADLVLKRLAHKTGREQAELIREAIEQYLLPESQPLPRCVGMGASGRTDLSERLSSTAIQVTAGVCGGQPRIRNTRIPVWTLVAFRQQGADDEEILRNYPSLTKDDLMAAWTYYEQHRSELDLAYPEGVATGIAVSNSDDDVGK